MGTVEINEANSTIVISSNILLYGNAANEALRQNIEAEISTLWNEAKGVVQYNNQNYTLQFVINCWLYPNLTPQDIAANRNPKNNYIRVEDTSNINISFVDGLGSNTGYFYTENLYIGSTTAAHEYGHTLGLDHPNELDIRGQGVPGIMYPRGTLVDAAYQYNADVQAGASGGTLFPKYRKILQTDIDNLNIPSLNFVNGTAVIGKYSNVWHEAH